jgi:hypothetical protein
MHQFLERIKNMSILNFTDGQHIDEGGDRDLIERLAEGFRDHILETYRLNDVSDYFQMMGDNRACNELGEFFDRPLGSIPPSLAEFFAQQGLTFEHGTLETARNEEIAQDVVNMVLRAPAQSVFSSRGCSGPEMM